MDVESLLVATQTMAVENPSLSSRLIDSVVYYPELERMTGWLESLQEKSDGLSRSADELENQMNENNPYFVQKFSGEMTCSKEEMTKLQLAFRRLKNFCRLQAKMEWYRWRIDSIQSWWSVLNRTSQSLRWMKRHFMKPLLHIQKLENVLTWMPSTRYGTALLKECQRR